jgi:hypothetical protein
LLKTYDTELFGIFTLDQNAMFEQRFEKQLGNFGASNNSFSRISVQCIVVSLLQNASNVRADRPKNMLNKRVNITYGEGLPVTMKVRIMSHAF